ncbi:MAG: hypothetical protein MI976_31405 [Pseudomonadales bacterium]|nr:hypothetical protein [Pseudomonadales bacterium]
MQRIQFSESVVKHGCTDDSLRASVAVDVVAVNGVAVCMSSPCFEINGFEINDYVITDCDPLTQINDEKIFPRIP